MPTYCLEFQASWQCRHEGACCRAGWPIPVEGAAFEQLRVHFGSRAERVPRFVTDGPLPDGAAAMLVAGADRACAFYDGRLCDVHRELGSTALPVACQQFPRIALHDARGTFVTLSHFCPTAARLLLGSGGLQVVTAPERISSPRPLEGLDAAHALPPLLTPRVLTDLEGYAEWERQCMHVLAGDGASAEQALDIIEAGTRRLVGWRPGRETLASSVSRAFGGARPRHEPWDCAEDARRFRAACAGVPRGLDAPVVPGELRAAWHAAREWWGSFDSAARRFVAAHLFGNWVAYHATTLLTVVEALRIGLSVLRIEAARAAQSACGGTVEARFIEAVRRADLLLVHLADVRAVVRTIETHDNFRSGSLPPLRHHRYPVG
jgi:hypothetical protein